MCTLVGKRERRNGLLLLLFVFKTLEDKYKQMIRLSLFRDISVKFCIRAKRSRWTIGEINHYRILVDRLLLLISLGEGSSFPLRQSVTS